MGDSSKCAPSGHYGGTLGVLFVVHSASVCIVGGGEAGQWAQHQLQFQQTKAGAAGIEEHE